MHTGHLVPPRVGVLAHPDVRPDEARQEVRHRVLPVSRRGNPPGRSAAGRGGDIGAESRRPVRLRGELVR